MAVRFLVGRAGSGKSHHCLQAIRRRLRHDAIDGPRLILLVPEQAALQMERAILDLDEVPVAHRCEVLSFKRLAYKVLESAPGPDRRTLSEPARAMVLRHLLARHAGELRYYRRLERVGGFIERLSATIAEFIEEAIEPSALEAALPLADEDNPARRAKLYDLHLLYSAYLQYLGDDRLDPSQHLQVACERIPRCAWLHGAEIWIDGFASLSGQETRTLLALGRVCGRMDITVLLDPRMVVSPEKSIVDPQSARMFRKTHRTWRRLQELFENAGIVVDDPLVLESDPLPRFRRASDIARVERCWLQGFTDGAAFDAVTEFTAPPADVQVVELPSRRVEVDFAVSRIVQWVQSAKRGRRYRDLAIIVRDLEAYHDLLGDALAARHIPFFIDRRRSIAHHPLVELLRAGAALVAESFSVESVRLALKSGLLPLETDAADELENYVIAHALAGAEVWRGADWSHLTRSSLPEPDDSPSAGAVAALARINLARRQFVSWVDPVFTFAGASEESTGSGWSAAVREWFNHLGVDHVLERWTREAEERGDMDQAAEHRQVWSDVLEFLDDMASAFATVLLAMDEFAAVLEQGLSGLTLGLAPPMIDQVLVGSIERSRHPDIKAALLLGFNEGIFPKPATEDSILHDEDRDRLAGAGVRLSPPARERTLDEALLAYIALTRAGEELVVTFAAADDAGKALRPSPYMGALLATCPGLRIKSVGDPIRTRQSWDVQTMGDLARRVVMEVRSRPPPDRDDPTLRSRWNSLYERTRSELALVPAYRHALAALDERNGASLSAETVQRRLGGPLRTSVSQLETYAACPFQFLAKHVLRLREREEAALAPVDVGQIHHAILEDFVGDLATRRLGLGQLSESELLEGLHSSYGRIAARISAGGAISNARDAYLLSRSRAQLARVLFAQRRAAQAGKARPHASELPFGFGGEGSMPALSLSTPAGRRVHLRGYIDRVDLAELGDEMLGVVVDYKRTRDKQLDLKMVYHGLSLQLVAYLLALAEHGESLAGRPVRPIAALYVSLTPHYVRVDHPSKAEGRDAALGGAYRPRGLLRAEDFGVLDGVTDEGWSENYSFYRKKDGAPGYVERSDAADGPGFQAVLDHTRWKLGQLADGILDGRMEVRPYRLGTFSPCGWCPMSSVCRKGTGLTDVRFLESLARSEVLKRLIDSPA